MWSLTKRYSGAPPEVREKAPLPTLQEALERGRKIIQELTNAQQGDMEASRVLDRCYGTTRYKWPIARCYRFHNGFLDAGARQAHFPGHDRFTTVLWLTTWISTRPESLKSIPRYTILNGATHGGHRRPEQVGSQVDTVRLAPVCGVVNTPFPLYMS